MKWKTCFQDRRDSWWLNPKCLFFLKIQIPKGRPITTTNTKIWWISKTNLYLYIYTDTETESAYPPHCQSVISSVSLSLSSPKIERETEKLHLPTCIMLTWLALPHVPLFFLLIFHLFLIPFIFGIYSYPHLVIFPF